MATCRPGAVEHTLEFQAGDHIVTSTPAILIGAGSIEGGETRRQHHRVDLDLPLG
jgi:hypothetical protein